MSLEPVLRSAIGNIFGGDVEIMSLRRILLIDDEQCISAVVQACLVTLGGWTVIMAASGHEGLLKAKSERPDAILLDVMMPDMNGVTLLRELRKEPATKSIPVVMLTAKTQLSDRHLYSNLDIAGIITKPFEPLKLVDQINEALGWR
jgi:DNA-binding response OmpR family regulator